MTEEFEQIVVVVAMREILQLRLQLEGEPIEGYLPPKRLSAETLTTKTL
jgi:hypothetical protein